MPLIVVVGRAAAKIFSQHDLVSDVFSLCFLARRLIDVHVGLV
jgi:hypothetical protein